MALRLEKTGDIVNRVYRDSVPLVDFDKCRFLEQLSPLPKGVTTHCNIESADNKLIFAYSLRTEDDEARLYPAAINLAFPIEGESYFIQDLRRILLDKNTRPSAFGVNGDFTVATPRYVVDFSGTYDETFFSWNEERFQLNATMDRPPPETREKLLELVLEFSEPRNI